MQTLLKRISDVEQYDITVAQEIRKMTRPFDFQELMNIFDKYEERRNE